MTVTGGQWRAVTLRAANLSGLILDGVSLVEADLAHADLTGASMNRCDLTRAVLRGADLAGCDLRGAVLQGSDVELARLHETRLSLDGAVHLAERHGAVVEV
jgi:uncharacterized protein YjbI with pentapeptide repeats